MLRRHPILTVLSLLGSAGLLSLILFLASFDLNHYREELESRLSSALVQPVQLGTASLALRPGPAFSFTGILIGKQDAPLLEAEGLALQAKLLPLLIGKLSFEKIVLLRPTARLLLSPSSEPDLAEPPPAQWINKLLNTVQVHSLQIQQGTLIFNDVRRQNQPFELVMTDIDLLARNIYSRTEGHLQFSSQLDSVSESRLQAAGSLGLPSDPSQWRQLWLDLSLDLEGFDPHKFLSRYAPQSLNSASSGRFDMKLTLNGSPREGFAFNSELRSDSLQLRLPEHYSHPLPLQRLEAAGRWTASAELSQFDNLVLRLNDLPLSGHFSLQQGEQDPWLEGSLSSAEWPLDAIARLLPAHRLLFRQLARNLPSEGTLQLAYSRFAGPLSEFNQQGLAQTIKEATLYLRDGRLRFGESPPISQISATANWKQEQLLLTDGKASWLQSPLQFSGSIEQPLTETASARFGAGWILPGRHLTKFHPHPKLQQLAAQGPIPVGLNINGPLARLHWTLQADLQACDLDYRHLLTKPAGMATGLKLEGTLTEDAIQLTESTLQLGPAVLSASGRYSRKAPQSYDLQLSLAKTSLDACRPLIPVLESIQLLGSLSGNYRLQSRLDVAPKGRGTLQLAEAGVVFPAVLGGKLHRFSGPVELYQDRIEWRGLSGLLGQSEVSLGGKVSNWSQPRTELDLAAHRVRADELIFSSPKAFLHDLSGRLIFDRSRIDFKDLQVTLDDGSRIGVDGRLSLGEHPELHLSAVSEAANVDSIVDLWQAPEGSPPSSEEHPLKVVVEGRVAKGTYQQLKFEQATATVTVTANRLHISPVNFSMGEGKGLAHITLQTDKEQNRQLRVSGQLFGVESGTLGYAGLIDRKGLLSGALDGVFQLQGTASESFLETAEGHFKLLVQDGVLRRYTFLARVFSLLNVSQIFSLELPDMVEKGMPFSRLEGEFILRDGLLTTEDLVVTSNAMNLSLIGDIDLLKDELNLILGVKPFGTVDKLVTRIPVAGWLLTGADKALITAHFEITGSSQEPRVTAIPVTSMSNKVLGIFRRVLQLPGKIVTDPREVITGTPQEEAP